MGQRRLGGPDSGRPNTDDLALVLLLHHRRYRGAAQERPRVLTAKTWSHSSSGMVQNSRRSSAFHSAALLTSASMRPNASTVFPTMSATLSLSDTSVLTGRATGSFDCPCSLLSSSQSSGRLVVEQVGNNHPRAFPYICTRHGASDALRGTGDDSDFVVKLAHLF